MEFELKECRGQELQPYLSQVAKLRMTVFREWPYLYDGSEDYEKDYLQTYLDSPDSYTLLAFHGDKLIGTSTSIPMTEAHEEVREAFKALGFALRDIMYFGESIILKEYRGQKLGHRFFEFRESYARKCKKPICCFCAVERPENHPLKPQAAQSLEKFWSRRGYRKQVGEFVHFPWKDVDKSEEDEKPLAIWTKTLSL